MFWKAKTVSHSYRSALVSLEIKHPVLASAYKSLHMPDAWVSATATLALLNANPYLGRLIPTPYRALSTEAEGSRKKLLHRNAKHLEDQQHNPRQVNSEFNWHLLSGAYSQESTHRTALQMMIPLSQVFQKTVQAFKDQRGKILNWRSIRVLLVTYHYHAPNTKAEHYLLVLVFVKQDDFSCLGNKKSKWKIRSCRAPQPTMDWWT